MRSQPVTGPRSLTPLVDAVRARLAEGRSIQDILSDVAQAIYMHSDGDMETEFEAVRALAIEMGREGR